MNRPSALPRHVHATSRGPVELAYETVDGPVALVLPGGHCDAGVDLGWDALRSLGLGVVSVSRPGYGATEVGRLSPVEFVEPLGEALRTAGVTDVRVVVGMSFGGPTAVEYAAAGAPRPEALVLLNAAPSGLPYPDTRKEALVAPIAFRPGVQRLTWWLVRRLVATDAGLRTMLASLSREPVNAWWPTWTAADREAARRMFNAMDSGSGFLTDLREGRRERSPHRFATLRRVAVPTLVVASAGDGSVSAAHATDLARSIPGAALRRTPAETHLLWLGPHGARLTERLREFLAAL